ncbi:Hypothetical protein FKW44_017413 [Caligus rogercresseyi]|uniref:Uncharacterized protein n=1 Tax=Caligus rogercresseyi TaxID=217165 RepID=A0A7T8GSW3_CALRO|nr:Hypothetical protein FKW44_017413 [Caligus rogercresseyi]
MGVGVSNHRNCKNTSKEPLKFYFEYLESSGPAGPNNCVYWGFKPHRKFL